MTDPADAPARRRLRDDVDLVVAWRDTTRCGGPIGDRLEQRVREVFAQAAAAVEAGADPIGDEVRAALARGVRSDAFAELAIRDGAAWRLHDDVLHPDPASTVPSGLAFIDDAGDRLDVAVPAALWPDLHTLTAELRGAAGAAPRAGGGAGERALASLMDALDRHGFLVPAPTSPGAPAVRRPEGVTMVGHASVAVHSAGTTVLVDPFLRPRSASYPSDYQPLAAADLGPVDAMLLTHGHPDHLDPASLLAFPRDTPLVVPVVERESILSPDPVARLGQLGFTDVRALPWGSSVTVGDITVHALPFLGEQPSTGPVLHPEATVAGNTYVLSAPWGRTAVVADGGHDRRGNLVDAAGAHREANGRVDVVFSGFRGWHTSPAELLRSSVARYLLFVPPDRWDRRENLMHDPAGAVATARAFGACALVPYADGGAPWFWDIGLGPRLDDDAFERAGFDLFPERVLRSAPGAEMTVEILRPGEHRSPDGTVSHGPHQRWPWPAPQVR